LSLNIFALGVFSLSVFYQGIRGPIERATMWNCPEDSKSGPTV